MKPFSTLIAVTSLVAASLSAQAQFTVDGRAATTEIGTGIGKYQLVASYTGTHSPEADGGLRYLYMRYTGNTLNIKLVMSAQSADVTPTIAYDYRAPIIVPQRASPHGGGRRGAPGGQ